MTISNTDNIIDSRDVIARIEELESDMPDVYESEDVPGMYGFTGCDSDCYETEEDAETAAFEHWKNENPDDAEELQSLRDFA